MKIVDRIFKGQEADVTERDNNYQTQMQKYIQAKYTRKAVNDDEDLEDVVGSQIKEADQRHVTENGSNQNSSLLSSASMEHPAVDDHFDGIEVRISAFRDEERAVQKRDEKREVRKKAKLLKLFQRQCHKVGELPSETFSQYSS